MGVGTGYETLNNTLVGKNLTRDFVGPVLLPDAEATKVTYVPTVGIAGNRRGVDGRGWTVFKLSSTSPIRERRVTSSRRRFRIGARHRRLLRHA